MAAAIGLPLTSDLELGRQFGELGDGVHVPRRSSLGGRNPELGLAHAFAVVDINLADAKRDPLVFSAGHMIDRLKRRRCVEKEGIGPVAAKSAKGLLAATAAISAAVRTKTPTFLPA